MLDIILLIAFVVVIVCSWLDKNYKFACMMSVPFGMMISYIALTH